MQNISKFTARLRELRGEMKQEDLGDLLGVSRGSISYYENGTRTPDALFIATAAKHFSVTADYLLGLSDNKTHGLDALAEKVPLEPKVLEFINECDPHIQQMLNVLLMSGKASEFCAAVWGFIAAWNMTEASMAADGGPVIAGITASDLLEAYRRVKLDAVHDALNELLAEVSGAYSILLDDAGLDEALNQALVVANSVKAKPQKAKKKSGPKAAGGGEQDGNSSKTGQ